MEEFNNMGEVIVTNPESNIVDAPTANNVVMDAPEIAAQAAPEPVITETVVGSAKMPVMADAPTETVVGSAKMSVTADTPTGPVSEVVSGTTDAVASTAETATEATGTTGFHVQSQSDYFSSAFSGSGYEYDAVGNGYAGNSGFGSNAYDAGNAYGGGNPYRGGNANNAYGGGNTYGGVPNNGYGGNTYGGTPNNGYGGNTYGAGNNVYGGSPVAPRQQYGGQEYSGPDYYGQNVYANDPFASSYYEDDEPKRGGNGLAIGALVCGIVSLATACSYLGIIPGIIAIVLANKAGTVAEKPTMAKVGMILGICGIVAGIIMLGSLVLRITTSLMDYF